MKQKHIVSLIVIFCMLAVALSNAEKSKEQASDHVSNHKLDKNGKEVLDQRNVWMNHLMNQKSSLQTPNFVVELDEQNNQATLKIMNVPISRAQKSRNTPDSTDFAKFQNSQLMKEFSRHLANQHDSANLPKVRRTRDIDFKIYDKEVIQALAVALRKIDPARADIIERNMFRAKIKVEIDDDDDDDESWYRRMKYALGFSMF